MSYRYMSAEQSSEIKGYASCCPEILQAYKNELEGYIDTMGIDKQLEKFDERIIAEGDTPSLREDLNDFLTDYACVDAMPGNYPIQGYKIWIVDNHARNYSLDDYIDDECHEDWFQQEVLKYIEERKEEDSFQGS